MDPLIFHDMVSLQVLLLDDVFSSNNMLGKDSGKKFLKKQGPCIPRIISQWDRQ